MMAIDTNALEQKYTNLYNAQLNPINQQRDATIQASNDQINADNTQYNNLYKGLDQQQKTAGDNKYTQSNAVDTTVNQNLNRVQNIMAKNGWLGGGENLQAQLDSNSDRSNNLGKVTTDYNTAVQGINTTRSNTQAEQNTKLQALQNAIAMAKSNAASNATALSQKLASDKANELEQLQAAEAQRQFQAQQAAAARAASAAKASASSNLSSAKSTVDDLVNGQYNLSEKLKSLTNYSDALGQSSDPNANLMKQYVQQALANVNNQMEQWNNSQRYSGMGNQNYQG